jgi:hypothetical protein
MDKIIAYCGLVCTACPAYIATQADDQVALERVAADWSDVLELPGITPDSVACDGCLARDGRLWIQCAGCEIRACGMARGVTNCAYCPDYVCARLAALFDHIESVELSGGRQDARAILDKTRQLL